MQRLLNPNEVALIDARLHDNTLLEVCRKIWPERQEEITTVMAQPVDIFYESAWLIDELVEADTNTDDTSLTRGLWSTVFNDIGYWANGVVSKNDRYLITSTIFRLVAVTFSLHWHSYYCNTLRDALVAEVDERRPKPKDLYEQQQMERQQDDLLDAIIACSAALKEWVNDYIDNPESWLTEEIDLALHPQLITVNAKTGKYDSCRKSTPTHTDDYSYRSFILNINRAKLELFYSLLSEKDKRGKSFIDGDMQQHNDVRRALKAYSDEDYKSIIKDTKPKDIDKMLFNMVFSGQDTDVCIVWRANANELLYLIDTMHNSVVEVEEKGRRAKKPLLEWTSGPRIWELTRSRFLNGKPRRVTDDRTGKSVMVDDPIDFKKDAFEAHNYPKNTTALDDIINTIAPNRIISDHEEIQNDFKEKASYRETNENSLGELKSEGNFRDTNHKSKE